MKRTNLVLNEDLLKVATHLLGAKTYSDAVNQALQETVRRLKVEGLAEFKGSGIWQGDLSSMRDDRNSKKKV